MRGAWTTIALLLVATLASRAGCSSSSAAAACMRWARHPISQGIASDLGHWRSTGLSQSNIEATLRDFASPKAKLAVPGVGILIAGGVVYLTSAVGTKMHWRDHHMGMITATLVVLEDMAATFEGALPDVEFVFATGDEPAVDLLRVPEGQDVPGPVLRFCTSDHHADVLVPYIHFQMRNFTTNILSHIADINDAWPWRAKKREAFGRFTLYQRIFHGAHASLNKTGAGGANICTRHASGRHECPVRAHFIEWAQQQQQQQRHMRGVTWNVATSPKVAMRDHASNKYLVHLDGQSCSSRLEQLLAMNSVVLKEESGYRAFYHHLLQPRRHYLPFWFHGPEDVVDAITWAEEHDAEARAMAAAAQELASEVLTIEALSCFWYNVLHQIALLLRYKPTVELAQARGFVQPVREHLASPAAKTWIKRYKLDAIELPSQALGRREFRAHVAHR